MATGQVYDYFIGIPFELQLFDKILGKIGRAISEQNIFVT